MREIKFRVWDKFFDTYFKDIENLIISGNGEIGIFEGNEWLGFGDYQDRFIIEQYTCLKDKNGIEIYEGDIVKTSGSNIYVVEFFDGKFNPVSELEGSDWEVIGNIHQDSDLLVDDIERMMPDDIGNDIHEFLHGGDK